MTERHARGILLSTVSREFEPSLEFGIAATALAPDSPTIALPPVELSLRAAAHCPQHSDDLIRSSGRLVVASRKETVPIMTTIARLRGHPPLASPRELKELLVTTLAQRQYAFFITADLHGPRTFEPIRQRLREWRNRVNRYYGGRRAVSPHRRARRMDGLVFFERGALRNSPHVHLVLDAPKLAEPTDFPLTAAAIWSSQYPAPTQIIRPYRAVTSGGKMQVDRIRDSPDDTARVLHYVLKETERPHPDAEPFVHIEDI